MQNGNIEGHLNVQRFYETWGRILCEKHGNKFYQYKAIPTVRLKEDAPVSEEPGEDRSIAV